ncbi:DUF106 domain-containing protein [archaeon]|nr:MAG: DUF106 domain-containing protein [archaeon]
MFEQITGMVGLVFGPITVLPPVLAIAVFSVILTLLVFGLNRLVVNKKVVDEIKAKMQEVRENLEKAQAAKDKANIDKHLKEMMEINNKFMKHSMRGMFIPLILAVILLPWISATYSESVIMLPFNMLFVGSSLSGIYWYILISLALGWVVNNVLGNKM